MEPRCSVCMPAEPRQREISGYCLWTAWKFTRTARSKYMAPPPRRNLFRPQRSRKQFSATSTSALADFWHTYSQWLFADLKCRDVFEMGEHMTRKAGCASRSRPITFRVCAYSSFALCAFLTHSAFALGAEPPQLQGGSKKTLHIEVRDAKGVVIAGPDKVAHAHRGSSAALALEREYQPGDRIVLSGPTRIIARLDESMQECS